MLSVRFLEPFYFSSKAALYSMESPDSKLVVEASRLEEGKDYESRLAETLKKHTLCLPKGYFLEGRL